MIAITTKSSTKVKPPHPLGPTRRAGKGNRREPSRPTNAVLITTHLPKRGEPVLREASGRRYRQSKDNICARRLRIKKRQQRAAKAIRAELGSGTALTCSEPMTAKLPEFPCALITCVALSAVNVPMTNCGFDPATLWFISPLELPAMNCVRKLVSHVVVQSCTRYSWPTVRPGMLMFRPLPNW